MPAETRQTARANSGNSGDRARTPGNGRSAASHVHENGVNSTSSRDNFSMNLGAITPIISLPISAREISAYIQVFDPDKENCIEGDIWLDEVDAARVENNWTSPQTLRFAAMQLRNTALDWYNTSKRNITDYETFRVKFMENFPTMRDDAQIHSLLKSSRKKSTENVRVYYHRLKAIAERGNVSTAATIRYIIMGLPSESRRMSLLASNFSTLYELLIGLQQTELELGEQRLDRHRHSPVRRSRSPARRSPAKRSRSRTRSHRRSRSRSTGRRGKDDRRRYSGRSSSDRHEKSGYSRHDDYDRRGRDRSRSRHSKSEREQRDVPAKKE
ncbi:hypothetical protein DMENIID0001_033570 [Sergentomyia squamirostris]